MKTKNRANRSGKVSAQPGKNKGGSYKPKAESKQAEKDPEIKVMGGTIRASYYKKMEKLLIFGSAANDPDEKKDDPYTPENMKIYDANKIDIKTQIEFWDCDQAMFRISKKCKTVKLCMYSPAHDVTFFSFVILSFLFCCLCFFLAFDVVCIYARVVCEMYTRINSARAIVLFLHILIGNCFYYTYL